MTSRKAERREVVFTRFAGEVKEEQLLVRSRLENIIF
jgi:hypothetical protein